MQTMNSLKMKELLEALLVLEIEGGGLFQEEVLSAHEKLKLYYVVE